MRWTEGVIPETNLRPRPSEARMAPGRTDEGMSPGHILSAISLNLREFKF
jgi:hypothetical protein